MTTRAGAAGINHRDDTVCVFTDIISITVDCQHTLTIGVSIVAIMFQLCYVVVRPSL